MAAKKKKKAPVKLLAGGNPQIAKGFGEGPVQAYIAALPNWKGEIVAWLDAVITRALPKVKKAVKWNSPMYGVDEGTYFLGIHVMTKYVKVALFRGTSLKPVPAGMSKSPDTRYVDLREGDALDAKQWASWIKQSAKLPGVKL